MPQTRTIQTGTLQRNLTIERADTADNGDRTVALSFSSEEPVSRFFGTEILDHDESSVRLDWFRSGNAPLLLEHDRAKQIGVVESVSLGGDRKGRAVVRLGKGPLAQEVLDDVRDGIRRNASIYYRLHEVRLEKSSDEEGDTYRATDWEPMEVSFVSVPADQTVGMGRGEGDAFQTIVRGEVSMPDDNTATTVGTEPAPTPAPDPASAPATVASPETDDAARAQAIEAARSDETARIRRINGLARHFDAQADADRAIAEGTSYEDFSENLLSARETAPLPAPRANSDGGIGLTQTETQRYSLMRAIRALADPGNPHLREAAAFEFECSRAASTVDGQSTRNGFVVPLDVMMNSDWGTGQRVLSAGVPTAGGNLVADNLLAGSFIDLLRNRSAIIGAGATLLPGLVGNVEIPKQTGGATAGFVSTEGGNVGESDPTVGQVPLAPKTLGAYTDITRQLMLQSTPAAEGMVRRDLVTAVALAIDYAALYGSGIAGNPAGVVNQVGVNKPAWGVAPTWAEAVGMETAIEAANADISTMWWIFGAATKGLLKTTPKVTGEATFLMADDGSVNGYGHRLSNQVITGEAFFAAWAELLIGMWGGLDLMANPYVLQLSGGLRVSVIQSVDVAVRHAQAFAHGDPPPPGP